MRMRHKHTFATADPEAAAEFVQKYLGGVELERPNHTCPSDSRGIVGQPLVRDLTLNGSTVALHFVYNPNKSPFASSSNATEVWDQIERLRGNFGQVQGTGVFDQFMDNHIGMVVSSLDPYVERWRNSNVPFVCRTWCCGPGMPQFPHECPAYSFNRTHGCEVGCYVEIPHGIIVELQCGIEGPHSSGDYNASRSCLTLVEPEVFDLCATGSSSVKRVKATPVLV
eukprot:gnl/TRDRNA2_/TRDRNA2_161790_c0_seq1.p1 gnl/TRDRNA2_/TRDRNA2_161790_c0~~gnl/TRDRNA2_/TRDRNA2_161790_c0_seq1.p1  ORF type:complete len:225 (+),score=14.81 gnl/TRDRNA2_/TRDRNA2_161790_c0_seq1:105-779(+)